MVAPVPESLLLLASPNPLSFQRLMISKSWVFFSDMRAFFTYLYQHRPNRSHSCLVHITQKYLGHQAGNKSISMRRGETHKCSSKWIGWIVLYWLTWVFPLEGTKGNYCMSLKFYLVLIWESLCEGFHFDNCTSTSGEVGNAHSDCNMEKMWVTPESKIGCCLLKFQASDLLSSSINYSG